MPERQVKTARKAARETLQMEKSPGTLNDFKLRTWTVSCFLSDLWYVNHASPDKRTLRSAATEEDRD
jgi:hypothetical protein